MSEITKKNLVLSFSTAAGKAVKLTIKEPAEGIAADVVSSVMDEIITTKALGEDGIVATKESAKYVIQEEDQITL